MLNKLKLHHNKRYQPSARVGHTSIVVGDRLYLWGGWHKGVPKQHSNAEKISALSVVEVFNLRTGDWGQIPTSGIPPLGVAYYSCVGVDEDIYYFGGRCGHGGCHHNTIHRLSTVTMKWKDITPPYSQVEEGPMKKAQCGMVYFKWRNEDLLFIMGGYGLLPVRHQPQATYAPKRGNPEYGWTNEGNMFIIKQGSWLIPEVTGEAPPPCSNFSIVSIGDNRGAMFGGFQPESSRLSDMYIVEMTKESVFWSRLRHNIHSSTLWPKGSCDQSMSYVSGFHSNNRNCPCVLVQGGEDDDGKTLSDCWIMELHTAEWKHVSLPASVAGRMYHSLSLFTVGPHCIWLVIFGGVAESEDLKDWQDQPMLGNTVVVELVKRSGDNKWAPSVIYEMSASSANNSTEEYIKKLNDRVFQGRKDWVAITGKTLSLLPADNERARADRAELRADSAEQQAADSRKKMEESENLISQVKQNAIKERKESISLYNDLSETRKRAQTVEQELQKTKQDLLRAKNEAARLEEELSSTKQKPQDLKEEAREEVLRMKGDFYPLQSNSTTSADSGSSSVNTTSSSVSMDTPDWAIGLDELKISESTMLSSRSGNVYSGDFYGSAVAVKFPRKAQSENEFVKMIERISKLRHPNLVLFVGATLGENLAIITEPLPSKPLNILIEEAPLSRSHLLSIAKDTTRGLHYLHRQHPFPLTHGSLSSRVIFVEMWANTWKAKLSDTGFYPLYSQPLAAYAAPEINPSPKMDVYAFGILVIEMYCRKALISSQSEREKQVQHINWPGMVEIVRGCLLSEPEGRLSMGEVLTKLCALS